MTVHPSTSAPAIHVSRRARVGRRALVLGVAMWIGSQLAAAPAMAASCGDGVLDPGEDCEAPFNACCNPATCAFEAAGTPVTLRATRDTRIMEAHRSSNDGAAGLFWLKRSSNVRGLVGFDASCQGAALDTIDCALLQMSVHEGVPTTSGSSFSVHRLDVPWVEGNQAFDDFSWKGQKLGSFPGTGTGTTWNCRVDLDLVDSGANNCPPEDAWWAGDTCGSGPCYQVPASSTAWYNFDEQKTLAWEVTSDVTSNPAPVSWLLKVTNEEDESSGSVKLYQRDGARFIAEIDPSTPAHVAFGLAPRLLLYGPNVAAPQALLVEPASHGAIGSTIVVGVDQTGTIGSEPARWENKTVGTWGYMQPGVVRDWEATIPLLPGPNEVEFTVFDTCSTEGQATYTLTSASGVFCGNGIVESGEECDDGNGVSGDCCSGACTIESDGSPCNDGDACTTVSSCASGVCVGSGREPSACGDSYLCYKANTSGGTPPLFPVSDIDVTDVLGDALGVLRRPTAICLPGSIEEEPVLDPAAHFVGYRMKDKNHRYFPPSIEVTDRFGTIRVEPVRADGLLASAGMTLDAPATPLADGIIDSHECYRVRLSEKFPKGIEAGLNDLFENRIYAVRKPLHLCLAADVAGSGVVNPNAHLMCYKVTRARGEPKHHRFIDRIHTEDDFATLQLDTRREAELCVPASIDAPIQ